MHRLTKWISLTALSVGLVVGSLALSASGAGAETCTPYPSGCSTPTVTYPSTTVVQNAQASAATPVLPHSSALAFTGVDVALVVVVGLLLMGGGAFFVVAARRRRAAV